MPTGASNVRDNPQNAPNPVNPVSSVAFQTKRARRGGNNFAALAKKVADNSEVRARILASPAAIFMHDHNAPTVRCRRAMVRREFLSLMRPLLTAEEILPIESSDADIERHCYNKDRIIDYGCMYLTAVGGDEVTSRGRIDDRFKIGQLRQRAEALWWYMIWFLLEEAGSIYPAWKLKSDAAMYQVAVGSSLGVQKYAKEYFGTPELWLLLQTVLSGSNPASWMKQHYTLWALVAMTGARPGSLTLIEGYKGQPQYLKWKDIRFLRIEGKPGLFLEIKLYWLKGQRDLHHAKATAYKGATFVVYPCCNKANLCADVTWLLTLLAIDRGLFGNRALEQLETSDMFELDQDPAISDQPVFLAGREGRSGISDQGIKPLSSSALNPVLQRTTRRSALPVRSTIYSFRREFITTVGRNASIDQAKELATHAPDTNSSYGRYDYGMGDINVTEIRFGESRYASSGTARNELRMTLSSPAVTKLHIPFNEEACKAHVSFNARNDQSVMDFEDTLRMIMSTVCEKFDLANATPSAIIDAVDLLVATSPASDNQNYTQLHLPEHLEDAAEWQAVLTQVVSPHQVTDFLKGFLRARKNNRAFVFTAIRKEYIKDWESSGAKPTLRQVSERRELSRNPIILQDSAASRELQKRPNAPVHVEAWKTANKSMCITNSSGGEDPSDVEDQRARWDGQDVMGEIGRVDFSEDLEEDLFDKLDDGAVVVAVGPDDDVAVDSDVSEAQIDKAYSEARALLIQRWNAFVDVDRGPIICPLCLAHPWDSKEVKMGSAFKYDRHVCAPSGVHNPEAGKGAVIEIYAQWCKDESGKYACRLCKQAGAKERIYGEYSKLSKHLKTHHIDFCKRLCH